MYKVAIVGVEGSGKTVMMATLGRHYQIEDSFGFFLETKNRATAEYCSDQNKALDDGDWPTATLPGTSVNLEWTLYRRVKKITSESVCEISFLDFAGEVYRLAFADRPKGAPRNADISNEDISKLRDHVAKADALIVLVNLKDVIDKDNRNENLWITQSILTFAIDQAKLKRVAIVFSQADRWAKIIAEADGVYGTFKKQLPHLRRFSGLPIFEVSAVNGTVWRDGKECPAKGFKSKGFEPLVEWIVEGVPKYKTFFYNLRERPKKLLASAVKLRDKYRIARSSEERNQVVQELEQTIAQLTEVLEGNNVANVSQDEVREVSDFSAHVSFLEKEFASILLKLDAWNLDEVKERFEKAVAGNQYYKICLSTFQEEMLERHRVLSAEAQRKKHEEDLMRTRRIRRNVLLSLAACGLVTVGYFMWNDYRARQKELQRKDRMGYTVDDDGFWNRTVSWREGKPHYSNPILETDSEVGAWRATRPGYRWIPGTGDVEWIANCCHPVNTNIVTSTTPDIWRAVRPGYKWVKGTYEDHWMPGTPHLSNTNLVAADEEGKWHSARPGYEWVENTDQDRWKPDIEHPAFRYKVSGKEEGTWKLKAGYEEIGSNVVWRAGIVHPSNTNLVSSNVDGEWNSTRPGYKWVSGTDRDVWHPSKRYKNGHAFAGKEEGTWEADPGYVLTNPKDPTSAEWKEGQRDPSIPHISSNAREGEWIPDNGYRLKNNNDVSSGVEWSPGVTNRYNAYLVADIEPETWKSIRPGYVWVKGTDTDTWKQGEHYGHATSEHENGVWKADPGYLLLDSGNPDSAKWTGGLTHPDVPHIFSSHDEENSWYADPGYRWNDMSNVLAGVQWEPGQRHGHAVSEHEDGVWKADPGYVLSDSSNPYSAKWVGGQPHPDVPHISSSFDKENSWYADPGYRWNDTSNVLAGVQWEPGQRHGHAISEHEDGVWKADPGYVLTDSSDPNSAKWKSGRPHGHAVSGYEEGVWIADSGYVLTNLRDPTSTTWTAGQLHPRNSNLVSDEKHDTWKTTRPGYEWIRGTDRDEWKQGLRHPNNSKLISDWAEGKWRATRPGYVWVEGTDRDEWKQGLHHPDNSKLVSDWKEGEWKSTACGYVWTGGAQTEWRAGLPHKKHDHWVSSEKEGDWIPEVGYEKVFPNIKDGLDSRAWLVHKAREITIPANMSVAEKTFVALAILRAAALDDSGSNSQEKMKVVMVLGLLLTSSVQECRNAMSYMLKVSYKDGIPDIDGQDNEDGRREAICCEMAQSILKGCGDLESRLNHIHSVLEVKGSRVHKVGNLGSLWRILVSEGANQERIKKSEDNAIKRSVPKYA